MANKTHRTATPPKNKPTDNRATTAKSAEMRDKLIGLGVPVAHVDTFPLTPHMATRRFCKKLPTPKGRKVFYFGPLTDWQAALDRYQEEKADLMAGRTPSGRNKDGLRLVDLSNQFLHYKRGLVDEGTLTLHSWYDYHRTCEKLMGVLGQQRLVEELGPEDFATVRQSFGAAGWGPVKIGNEVNRTRMIFRYGIEQGLIGKPILFGKFKRPDKKTLRMHRAKQKAKHGPRMFTADELHRILDAADAAMKAMVMLGANGGLNNSDVATLYFDAMDLDKAMLDFPRGKTGVPRRIPLWPETVAAIKAWLAVRPEPKHETDAHLVFLTRMRRAWFRLGRFTTNAAGKEVVRGIDNPVSKSFRVLLDKIGLNGRRNFLALRHGFRTIGRGAKDREAIDALMGHVDGSMASHYIEDGLPDERLRAVTEFVRRWFLAG